MDKSTLRRIDNTLKHLTKVTSDIENIHPHHLSESPNLKTLKSILDGEYHYDRDRLKELFEESSTFDEVFLNQSIHTDQHREQTLKACKEIIQLQIVKLSDMEKNPKKFLNWFESISYCDPSVSLKFAVQYNLWGGTVLFLGTKKHHDLYLDGIESGDLLGVFGLTELGHGSNVNGLETTATYDENSDQFIINSPTWNSQKYWPGNISRHGQMATVFARLILKGVDKGVHAFIVPIRGPKSEQYPYGKLCDGVQVRDISLKDCYNGIDNGGLSFKNVRIPRDNMLDRFSQVDSRGQYHSDIPPNRHFAMTMSVFFIGRICLSLNSLAFTKAGLSIAVNYANNRRQFGATTKSKEELPIMSYSTTQRRIIPFIARTYALDMAHKAIADLIPTYPKEVIHSYTSGFKAITSWAAVEALQQCREVLGGQGLRLCNRIAMLRNHADLVTTGEGDNTVLTQQVAKYLLSLYHQTIKGSKKSPDKLSFKGELAYINNLTSQPPTPNTNANQLLNISYHQWLLEKREFILVKELHSRLYGREDDELIQPNTDRWFTVWNQSLPLCIKITKANVDRLTQSFFLKKIVEQSASNLVDTATLTMLKNLCRLDALVQIQKDFGFFINTGLMFGESKWIQLEDEITHLSRDISHHSSILTQAFSIPNKFNPLQNSIE